MKAIALLTLLSAVVSGAVTWHQTSDTLRLKEEAASLAVRLEQKHVLVRQQETQLTSLQEGNAILQTELTVLRKKAAVEESSTDLAQNAPAPPAVPPRNDTAEVLARISDNPEMKQVFREWDFAKIKEVYGAFVRAQHLNPLQTKQFFDLLTEARIQSKQEYFDLFATGEAKSGPSKSRIEAWLKQKREIDQKLRILLGPETFAAFEEYEKSGGY